MNMFKDFLGNNNGSITTGDIPGTLELVHSRFALSSYTHPPFMRRHNIDAPGAMLDEMAMKSANGSLDNGFINQIAIKSSMLSSSHTGEASITGGWQEYNKGIGVLKFRIKTGGIDEIYISVLGYVTGNQANNGLDTEAYFIPVHSWKTHNQLTNGINSQGELAAEQTIGIRTDYITGGDSVVNTDLKTIRPTDVLTTASITFDTERSENFLNQVIGNTNGGLSIPKPNNVSSASIVSANGAVLSNRANYNPTAFAKEIFTGLVQASELHNNTINNANAFTTMGVKSITSSFGEVGSNVACKEPNAINNEFSQSVKSLIGAPITSRGIQINELMTAFPNFENTFPRNELGQPYLEMMDRSRVEVINFADLTEVFGTSNAAEVYAQSILFNMLDLMTLNGVNSIYIEGSNCHKVADVDMLSNIVMFHANATTLKDFDVDVNGKAIKVCEGLKNEIFNQLNGTNCYNITPLTWKISSDLFTITEVWITPMDPTNSNPKTFYFSFPTSTPSPYSPILTNTAQQMTFTNGIYENMKSYLFK